MLKSNGNKLKQSNNDWNQNKWNNHSKQNMKFRVAENNKRKPTKY